MAAPFATLESDIQDAKRAVGLARRDLTELERQAKTYYDDDEINFSSSFRYAYMLGKEKLEKAERKLNRLLKRKTNPMPKRKATALQLRNLAKGRKKLAAMRRAGTVRKKRPTRATRPRRKRNPEGVSHEAYELVLWVENSAALQNQRNSILKNIARKINSGIYDPAKAPVLWKYLMDSAAKDYTKEFDVGGGYGVFTAPIRREAAGYYAPQEYASILAGDYEYITGPVSAGSKKKKKRRAKKRATPPQMFTPPRGKNPASGNFMNARKTLRTGRATNPVRPLHWVIGSADPKAKPSGSRIQWWTGKDWSSSYRQAAEFSNSKNAAYAARKMCNRKCAVVKYGTHDHIVADALRK